jgi:23S rRNA pseudouridine2605 synthase
VIDWPDEPDAPTGERLQKFLSAAGVASRRHAEVMIRTGRVTVNETPAHVGMRVQPGDVVRVDGVEVGPDAPVYLLYNKPVGVVTTMDDPQGRPTVASEVESPVRVYPVGRLDIETSGLLVLTNDGEMAHRLMHPSYGVEKTYRVLARGAMKKPQVRALAEGVELEDGPTAPATARLIQTTGGTSLVELTIHEGRNRQVRRMFDAIGHPVQGLVRVAYGPLQLGDLKSGVARPLTSQEIRRLRKAVGLARPRRRDEDDQNGR